MSTPVIDHNLSLHPRIITKHDWFVDVLLLSLYFIIIIYYYLILLLPRIDDSLKSLICLRQLGR